MDIDHPMAMDYQDIDLLSSQTPNSQDLSRADGDVVTWQSSQSCPVLASLMTQTVGHPDIFSRQPRLVGPLWDSQTPFSSFSTPSWSDSRSTSSAQVRSRTRPPSLRSSRVPNTRRSTLRRSSTSASIPSISSGHYTEFLTLMHNVSAQVDDNTQRKTRLFNRQRAANASFKVKSLKENRRSASSSNSPTNATPEAGPDNTPIVGHRNRPTLNTSPMFMDDGALMEGDTSFRMHADAESHPSSAPQLSQASTIPPPLPNASTRHSTIQAESRMPPPPLPLPKPSSHVREQLRGRGGSRPDTVRTSSSSSNPPPLKVHPLLLNRPSPPPPPPPQPQPKPIKPVVQLPRPSQPSSRPPVLGMRRTSTCSSFSPSQTLPNKQKGFKPPLARPLPKVSQAHGSALGNIQRQTPTLERKSEPPLNPNVSHGSSSAPEYPRRSNANLEDSVMEDVRPRSSSPAAEADSSFGDMSFDMDALEETMRQYD